MLRGKAGGCAFADVSTGEVCAASFETDAAMHIQNEISRFRPRECVLAPEAMLSRDIRDTLEKRLGSRVEPAAGRFDPENARKAIANQYGEDAPEPRRDDDARARRAARLSHGRGARRHRRSCACRISSRGAGIWSLTPRRGAISS